MDDDQGNPRFINNDDSFTLEIKSRLVNYNENNVNTNFTKIYYQKTTDDTWK